MRETIINLMKSYKKHDLYVNIDNDEYNEFCDFLINIMNVDPIDINNVTNAKTIFDIVMCITIFDQYNQHDIYTKTELLIDLNQNNKSNVLLDHKYILRTYKLLKLKESLTIS
jgi:hypothetical protein